MSAPSISREANTQAAPAPHRAEARRRRRWWRSGKLWVGVLGTMLGAAATLGVNEVVAKVFPETDRASRLIRAVQELTGEMQTNRDEVARLASRLRAQEPGSPGAAETARQLEASADELVQTSESLAARVTDLAGTGARLPPAVPPRAAENAAAPVTPATPTSTTVAADSAPQPDLWLPSYQSTMIGASRNSFGVRSWGTTADADRILVGLNGGATWLHAGDRLQFPDSDEECYVIYLRTVNPDPAAEGDERHGFALTCAPKTTAPR